MAIGSVERVRQALVDLGHADTVAEFPDGTRTAADAAADAHIISYNKTIIGRSQSRES